MKYIYLTFITILTILILWINLKLHTGNSTFIETKADILLQLNFVESELKNNLLGQQMQQIFPEGFVFANVIYGLAWCELALTNKMADAFISWGRATALKNFKQAEAENQPAWQLRFHLISFLIILVFWSIFFRKPIIKFINTGKKPATISIREN